MSFHVPKNYMISHPTLGFGEANNGYFRFEREGVLFHCIASDGAGWEHVSVTLNKKRCPTWQEMCLVKDMFWDSEDVVIQYHAAKSEHVNNHNYCLHLWRPIDKKIECPPSILVGVKKC